MSTGYAFLTAFVIIFAPAFLLLVSVLFLVVALAPLPLALMARLRNTPVSKWTLLLLLGAQGAWLGLRGRAALNQTLQFTMDLGRLDLLLLMSWAMVVWVWLPRLRRTKLWMMFVPKGSSANDAARNE